MESSLPFPSLLRLGKATSVNCKLHKRAACLRCGELQKTPSIQLPFALFNLRLGLGKPKFRADRIL